MWFKNWRVRVDSRFREHMTRAEAYPSGWTSRRYFPPREPRNVAELHPTKKLNSRQFPAGDGASSFARY